MSCLTQLLEDRAARGPDDCAVICEGQSVSWRQLLRESIDIAARLRTFGVKPGDRVGVYAFKSVRSVAAIHGVLRAGAAYVPIDPRWPPHRSSYLLDDCGIRVGVAEERTVAAFAALSGKQRRCVVLDPLSAAVLIAQDETQKQGEPVADGAALGTNGQDAEQLAYVMYTSGSTGRPKGVAVTRRAVFHWVEWGCDVVGLGSEDRIGNLAPLQFDLSAFDLFSSAYSGATLALIPETRATMPWELGRFLEESRPSFIYWVPSALVEVLERGGIEDRDLSSLHTVFFAGEVFPTRQLERWMRQAPRASFFNLYGSTEAPCCTYQRVAAAGTLRAAVPIGVPCPGIEIMVVDDAMLEVEEGTTGEILVGGPTLMKGYWNQPHATGESLHRILAPSGERVLMYRTGDLGFIDCDGCLHFAGRRDQRTFKRRGVRIHLAEVEWALSECKHVEQGAVVALNEDEFDPLLVAFVSPRGSFDERRIQSHLQHMLPKHLVPDRLVKIHRLPRTSSGKVDRRSLREDARIRFGLDPAAEADRRRT